MTILKAIFPALMVVGAIGSLAVNLIEKGEFAVSLQWTGAALLYTALLIKNAIYPDWWAEIPEEMLSFPASGR